MTIRFVQRDIRTLMVCLSAIFVFQSEAYAQSKPTRQTAPAAQAGSPALAAVRSSLPRQEGMPYFIEFRSRYALSYGHTFVVFGRLGANGKVGKISPAMVAGLHPAGEGPELWTVGHVLPVPSETGASDGDTEEEYVSARWQVRLTRAEYDRVVAFIRKHQKESPTWHAALYNCNAWTGDVAKFMGFDAPFHWLKPQDYINRMKQLNDGKRPFAQGVAETTGG